jgi:hypothetical protein
MAFTGRTIAAGTTGGLTPDPTVRVDNIAGQDVQVTKLCEATEGSVAAIGIPSNPLSVKTFDRGSTVYDSGRTAVPAASGSVTASTVFLRRIIVQSISNLQQAFSALNAADVVQIDAVPIAPHERRVFDEGDAEWAGIKCHANGNAGALLVWFEGRI